MQSVPAVPGNADSRYSSDPHSSSSSSSARPDTPVLRTVSPQQALWQAIHVGDTTTVKTLLVTGGIDINAVDPLTRLTPLMLAARQGHEEVTLALIRARPGADVNWRNNRGESALSLAATGGKTEVVELLLDRKADIEQCGRNGRSALVEAVAGARRETVELLLERGARIDGARGGKVPLAVAARHGDSAMVELLLEKKASVQMTDSDGWTAVNHAANRGHDELAQRLQDRTTTTLTTTTTSTTTTVTTLVVTARPGTTAPALGVPVMGSTLLGTSENAMADDPEVQRLAERVVEGKLELREKQSEGTIKALAALLGSPQCKVKELDLRDTNIRDAAAASLSEALKVNRTLTKLNLGDNWIDNAGATSLSEALKVNCTLTELNLSYNALGGNGTGTASLSESLRANRTLIRLDLSGNQIDAVGAAALSEALKVNRTLTELDLSSNKIGDAGVASLSKALALNPTLTKLDLSVNQIDAAGVAALSKALKVNRTLTELALNGDEIGVAGAASLLEARKVNSTLTVLHLRHRKVENDLQKLLSSLLKNSSYMRSEKRKTTT